MHENIRLIQTENFRFDHIFSQERNFTPSTSDISVLNLIFIVSNNKLSELPHFVDLSFRHINDWKGIDIDDFFYYNQ